MRILFLHYIISTNLILLVGPDATGGPDLQQKILRILRILLYG
jgi:hypothetical protein